MVGTVLTKVKAQFWWSREVLSLFCLPGTLDFVLIWSLLNFTGITLEGIARAVGRSQRWESSHPTQQLKIVVAGGARWNRGGCLPRCLEDCTRCLPPPCSSCPASPTSTSSVALRLYLDDYIFTSNDFVGVRKWPKYARAWQKRNDWANWGWQFLGDWSRKSIRF